MRKKRAGWTKGSDRSGSIFPSAPVFLLPGFCRMRERTEAPMKGLPEG